MNTAIPLRSPADVMRLSRMGSMHATRLSFMPTLLRRMRRENWQFERIRFDVDKDGFGTTVLAVHTPDRTYSLIAFSHALDPEQRTDRVIAEAWDATFNLFDGVPTDADIERLSGNTPLQESGRFLASELVLARANKSVRLFNNVVECLAKGQQPDIDMLCEVGYLMRTTAVYGNGKFGCADRARTASRDETQSAFQLEMIAVYLIRWFTVCLVEHVASVKGGEQAVPLDPNLCRYLGIGNATGLGMAPFLIRHPKLIHRWCKARETALARVRSAALDDKTIIEKFKSRLDHIRKHLVEWNVADEIQQQRVLTLRNDMTHFALSLDNEIDTNDSSFWENVFQHSKQYSLEGQELVVSIMMEFNGHLIDDLADTLFDEERMLLNPAMSIGVLRDLLKTHYQWVNSFDFSDQKASDRFWYYSEDKIEPRLGKRYEEEGAELEMPLGIAYSIHLLGVTLTDWLDDQTVGEFCMQHPEHRHIIRRAQSLEQLDYAEVQDNLLDTTMRPIDLLRFKLAFFGASKFDPKSDLWTRITMYQGAPMPHEIPTANLDSWMFPVSPSATATA